MALRFYDGFDHYTAQADQTTKWTDYLNASDVPGAAVGRFGGGWPNSQQNQRSVYKTLDSQATWVIGAAVYIQTGLPSAATPLFVTLDALTRQCYLQIQANTGKLQVVRESGVVLGTGTFVFSANIWYYVEFKVTISDAAGVAVARINAVTDINLSSEDTKNTANATADAVALNGGAIGSLTRIIYDDVYMLDGTGSSPYNDFLGDVRVQSLFPGGNGNSSVLVGSDGNSIDNYLLVDEASPNGDTDYVESSTVGDKDTYAFGNLTPAAGTVYAVQLLPYARKTDAGVRSIKTVARHSATEEDSADLTLSTSYQYFEDIRTTKPGGGTWSISDVNGAEFGCKISA
jgi:hypothetical protein